METLVVPEHLNVDEAAAFIREELIKRNIDPDSIYPIDQDFGDSSNGKLDLTMTVTYDHFTPSSDTHKNFIPEDATEDVCEVEGEREFDASVIEYGSITEYLNMWRNVCSDTENKDDK